MGTRRRDRSSGFAKMRGRKRRRKNRARSTPSASSAVVRNVMIVVVVVTGAALIGLTVYLLSFLLFLVVLAVFFAYLIEPLVRFIRTPFVKRDLERLMPRTLAIAVAYLLVFSFLVLAVANLAPRIGEQARDFADNLPAYRDAIEIRLTRLNERYEQLQLSPELQKVINERVSSFIAVLSDPLTAFAGNLAFNVFAYLPWMLLVPILSFFFLKDAKVYRNLFLGCFPSGRWRARAESIVTDVNNALAGYARAQLVAALLIGSLCTLAFTSIGLDYALLLGILAGLFEFVPLLGPLIIGITATLVGAFSANPWQGLYVPVFLILLRMMHDYVTYPRIVRDGVHLHPLAVILSVLAGEQLAGIAGIVLSIPIVALVTILHRHLLEHSGRTGLLADFFSLKQ